MKQVDKLKAYKSICHESPSNYDIKNDKTDIEMAIEVKMTQDKCWWAKDDIKHMKEKYE